MHFLDQTSSMDVRFYPAAAGSALPGDPSNLDFAQCLGYYNYNKVIIPAGVNSSCCCPGRFPADRSWGSVGAGRLGAGGCSEPGAGAPAALRGAGGCSEPGKLWSAGLERRGRTPPPAVAAAGLAPGNPPSGRCSGGSEGCERQTAGKSSGRDPAPHGRRTKARPELAAFVAGSELAELSPGGGRGGSGRVGQSPVGLDGPSRRGRSLPLLCSLGSVRLC